MRGKREIRREARYAVYALIAIHVSTDDGDLFTGVEGWDEDEMDEFVAEVERIMERIHPGEKSSH